MLFIISKEPEISIPIFFYCFHTFIDYCTVDLNCSLATLFYHDYQTIVCSVNKQFVIILRGFYHGVFQKSDTIILYLML